MAKLLYGTKKSNSAAAIATNASEVWGYRVSATASDYGGRTFVNIYIPRVTFSGHGLQAATDVLATLNMIGRWAGVRKNTDWGKEILKRER